jgi:hypothetical protein
MIVAVVVKIQVRMLNAKAHVNGIRETTREHTCPTWHAVVLVRMAW